MTRDNTKRQKAESAQRYKQIIESLPVAVYTCDAEGKVTLYNEAAAALWGRRPEIGKDLWCGSWRMYHLDGSPMPHKDCPMAIAIREGRSIRGIEIVVERPDGGRSHVLPHPDPIRDTSGKIIGAVNMLVDLTERMEVEQALRESEERFRQLAENVNEVFWLGNPEGTQLDYVSPAYEKIWGRNCEKLRQSPRLWLDSIHPDDSERVLLALEKRGATGEYDESYRILRPDGSIRWIHAQAFPVRDADGKVVRIAGIAKDMTDMSEATEKLQLLSHQLLRAQEDERSNLAQKLHDEIGQALTALKIDLQAVQTCGDGPTARQGVGDGVGLVDQLLQQVRQIALDLRPSILDHLGLIPALRWYFDQQRQRSGLKIDFRYLDLPSGIPAEIQTACYRIAQEAMTNIIRHAHAQKVVVDLRESNGTLAFSIHDDGVGFDLEKTKLQASLGLVGMRERALLVGGSLDVTSQPTNGTIILAQLPLAPQG